MVATAVAAALAMGDAVVVERTDGRGEKWQTRRRRSATNLIYRDRYAPATTDRSYRQTLCTPDIFQTSSVGCLLLNYRLYTRASRGRSARRPGRLRDSSEACVRIVLPGTSGHPRPRSKRHLIGRRLHFEFPRADAARRTSAVN